MAIDALRPCQAPQPKVAGKQHPAVLRCEGKGETVDEGKRWFAASVVESLDDSLTVQFSDTEPAPDKIVASVPAQLAFKPQVRDHELERKTEHRLDE